MTRRAHVVDLGAVRASLARLDVLVREHPRLVSPEARARADRLLVPDVGREVELGRAEGGAATDGAR